MINYLWLTRRARATAKLRVTDAIDYAMTKVVIKDEIRAHVLKVLSGYCFAERQPHLPKIFILSPWISNVQLEIDKSIFESDRLFFGLDYGILSINLPYALLALKLDFGADISIVTLPPTKENYRDPHARRELLDFLDEIGCNVYVNPDFHSKLILSNDLALVGSFNLTVPALSGREEIGVCIDDIGNLRVLENYAYKMIGQSRPYGYTGRAHEELLAFSARTRSRELTRGLLFEEIVKADSRLQGITFDTYESCHEFIFFYFKTIYTKDLIKKVASNLEAFYTKAILAFLQSKSHSNEKRLEFLRSRFYYKGKHEVTAVLDFLSTRLARDHVPRIPPDLYITQE